MARFNFFFGSWDATLEYTAQGDNCDRTEQTQSVVSVNGLHIEGIQPVVSKTKILQCMDTSQYTSDAFNHLSLC